MDHVLNMMEKYAITLEQQVDERTKQLAEEQKKSDILLYRILPRFVNIIFRSKRHQISFFEGAVAYRSSAHFGTGWEQGWEIFLKN